MLLDALTFADMTTGPDGSVAAPERVAEILGHAQVSLTLNVYTHVPAEETRAALAAVDGGLHRIDVGSSHELQESV